MKVLNIYYIDTNNIDINRILLSKFIREEDKELFLKYNSTITKKEKIASTYFKNKYVGAYEIDSFGKPVAKDKYFNISHSYGVVVFVLDTVPIGIDIEIIKQRKPNLVDYVCSEDEKTYVDSDIRFVEVWTNKEALIKANGIGIKDKLAEVPSIPINSKKTYRNKQYISKTITFNNFVITIAREDVEYFEIELVKEEI